MKSTMRLTRELAAALVEQLRPIDLALGTKLLRGSPLSPRPPLSELIQPEARLFWLAALTSYAQGQAHSGLSLDPELLLSDFFDAPDKPFPEAALRIVDLLGAGDALCREFPERVVSDAHLAELPQAAFVYRPDCALIYFQRWYSMEQKVAAFVRKRLQQLPAALPDTFDATFQQFFPPAGLTDNPWQAAACFAALRHSFSIITGGPGTGKTTTVARLVGLLLSLPEAERPLAMHMVAPTGKAAERMRESFAENFEAMLNALPEKQADVLRERTAERLSPASTIHAFLGSRGGRGFQHHAGNPVHCDLLIVDESSMVDLELFIYMLDALPAACRLVLIGDKKQLAAVGTGNLFSDLTGSRIADSVSLNSFSAGFHQGFKALSKTDLPAEDFPAAICGDAVVELTHSYRFQSDSAVGSLARLLLGEGRLPMREESVPCHSFEEDWQAVLEGALTDYKAALTSGQSAAELLAVIARVRILCAVRRSDQGVEGINRMLGNFVLGPGVFSGQPTDGLPFMIRSNDHNLKLANGDCGIFRLDVDGELGAFLPPGPEEAEPRRLNPYALPDWEPAFALTIHKSQGSEYDQVVVVLPETKRRFITWELVYTAITRGKSGVTLVLPESLLGTQLPRSHRRSGLRQELLLG